MPSRRLVGIPARMSAAPRAEAWQATRFSILRTMLRLPYRHSAVGIFPKPAGPENPQAKGRCQRQQGWFWHGLNGEQEIFGGTQQLRTAGWQVIHRSAIIRGSGQAPEKVVIGGSAVGAWNIHGDAVLMPGRQ